MATQALPRLPRPRRLPDPADVRARLERAARAATYYGYDRPARALGHAVRVPGRWWTRRAYRPRWAAVQGHGAYASVPGIADDCLRLKTGQYRAVIEVDGVGWARLAEDEQDALIDSNGWVLNGLTHPIQWSALTRPTDLEAQALGLERAADAAERGGLWSAAYLRFVRAKAQFLREDGQKRTLKRRRYLCTVPTEHLNPGEAREELAQRSRDLLDQFGRLGLHGRRLQTPELGRLVYETWHPGVLGSGGAAVPLVATDDEWAYAAADITLPGRVERHGDDLRVLGEAPGQEWWLRTLVLTWWPSQVTGMWLAPLVQFREAVDLSLHITPLDDGERKEHHRQRLTSLEDARAFFANKLPLPGRELAVAHTQLMTGALEEGRARSFHVSLYALLRAPTKHGLDDLTQRVQREVQGVLARSRTARGEPDRAFLSCRPEGTDALGAVRELDTGAVAQSFVACTSGLVMDTPGASLYGYDGDQAVIFDRFDDSLTAGGELNSCEVILAPPGAGKSVRIKRQIPDEIARGVAVAVFDVEGEYAPFTRLFGPTMAQDIVPDGTTGHRINAFELPPADPTADARQRNPVRAQTLAVLGLIDVAIKGLSPDDVPVLDRAILATYAAAGITPEHPGSWGHPVPDMTHLEARLRTMGRARGGGEEAARARSLASRLSRFTTGSLAGLFTGGQTVTLDKLFVRFDLSGIDDALYPLVSYLCATWLWTEQQRHPRKRVFVADEAWRWKQYQALRLFMQDLARRGRKWLLAPVFVFHSGDDFVDDDTRVVLECSSMQYVMRQSARSIDATARRFKLGAADRRFLVAAKKGEGLFFARGTHSALTLGEIAPCEAPLVLTGLQAHGAPAATPAMISEGETEAAACPT